ncbi:hypothetical protein LINGRAHAP2_LOCUS35066, partial [Linum grandiflorum]
PNPPPQTTNTTLTSPPLPIPTNPNTQNPPIKFPKLAEPPPTHTPTFKLHPTHLHPHLPTSSQASIQLRELLQSSSPPPLSPRCLLERSKRLEVLVHLQHLLRSTSKKNPPFR